MYGSFWSSEESDESESVSPKVGILNSVSLSLSESVSFASRVPVLLVLLLGELGSLSLYPSIKMTVLSLLRYGFASVVVDMVSNNLL